MEVPSSTPGTKLGTEEKKGPQVQVPWDMEPDLHWPGLPGSLLAALPAPLPSYLPTTPCQRHHARAPIRQW